MHTYSAYVRILTGALLIFLDDDDDDNDDDDTPTK